MGPRGPTPIPTLFLFNRVTHIEHTGILIVFLRVAFDIGREDISLTAVIAFPVAAFRGSIISDIQSPAGLLAAVWGGAVRDIGIEKDDVAYLSW